MSEQRRKIAIADPVSSGAKLARRAQQRGYDIVELRTVDASEEFYSRGYDPSTFVRLVEHRGDFDSTLLQLEDVEHVLAGADSSVAVVEQLNLRRGQLQSEAALLDARADKREFARVLERSGIRTVRQELFVDVEKAVAFAYGRYPIVLKPRASGGTQGVTLAGSEGELRQQFARIVGGKSLYGRPNAEALLMDYVPLGATQELVVDTVSSKGRHVVTDTWAYEKVAMHGVPAMYRVMRTVPMAEMREEIAFTLRMLDALGHRQGPAHAELWRVDDPAQRARFGADHLPVEIGFRLPGVITELAAEAFGRDQVELSLDAVLAPERFAESMERWALIGGMRRHAAVVFLASRRDGLLERDLDTKGLLASPSYHSSSFKALHAGDMLQRTVDLGTIVGWVGLVNEDRAALERDIANVQALELELGNDVQS